MSCVRKIVHLELIIFVQMFRLKLKIILQRKEWIKSSEDLQNCSIGFHFPLESEEIAEVFHTSSLIFI